MAKKTSQTELLEHSQAKIWLLSEYLKRYLNVLAVGQYPPEKILIFDLFTGPGIYSKGGEGSPIAILKEIQKIRASNVGRLGSIPPIDVWLNDSDTKHYESTKSAIDSLDLHKPEYGTLTLTNEKFEVLLSPVLRRIAGNPKSKAFVFIDPYGYKDIRIEHVKSLLAPGNSEVLYSRISGLRKVCSIADWSEVECDQRLQLRFSLTCIFEKGHNTSSKFG